MKRNENQRLSAVEVERAIGVVRAYYAEGVAELQKGRQYGSGGSASEKVYRTKARLFATPETGYTQANLNRLFNDFRQHGWMITISHFDKLVTVPRGPDRDALEIEIFTGRWSVNQLKLVIRQRFGNRRPHAGRRRRVSDWEDATVQMTRIAEQWFRLRRQGSDATRPLDVLDHNNYTVVTSHSLGMKLKAVDAALADLKKYFEKRRLSRST